MLFFFFCLCLTVYQVPGWCSCRNLATLFVGVGKVLGVFFLAWLAVSSDIPRLTGFHEVETSRNGVKLLPLHLIPFLLVDITVCASRSPSLFLIYSHEDICYFLLNILHSEERAVWINLPCLASPHKKSNIIPPVQQERHGVYYNNQWILCNR